MVDVMGRSGKGKRGQQMTLTTIIAIVLGIAVLVFLIWGFSQGWSSLWDQVTGRTSGSNVQVRITDCETDCNNKEKSAWCYEVKDLRFIGKDGKTVKISGSCKAFSINDVTDPSTSTNEARNVYPTKEMGFVNCPAISC